MENQKHRPLGITIIAILAAIVGIFLVAGGAVFLIVLIGIVPLVIGIAYLVVAYGLWKAKTWAWIVTLIVSAISIIASIVEIAIGHRESIFSIIVPAIIIFYLYRPNVKAYFGR
jgi:uncharacterized membrane protein HdeD (DUF308 family)